MTHRTRLDDELALLRSQYPELEFRDEDYWARIPRYELPEGWAHQVAEMAFQVPRELPGQQPYGFWVRPLLMLPTGAAPENSQGPVSTGFGEGWQQFSWAPEVWRPAAQTRGGSNLLDFVRSFRRRLQDVS
jgi:Prokaryotic E2 family E